jgi:hypothetical protein
MDAPLAMVVAGVFAFAIVASQGPRQAGPLQPDSVCCWSVRDFGFVVYEWPKVEATKNIAKVATISRENAMIRIFEKCILSLSQIDMKDARKIQQ